MIFKIPVGDISKSDADKYIKLFTKYSKYGKNMERINKINKIKNGIN